MSYIVPRWSQITLEDTCRPMFWLNFSLMQIMWKWRFTPKRRRNTLSETVKRHQGQAKSARDQSTHLRCETDSKPESHGPTFNTGAFVSRPLHRPNSDLLLPFWFSIIISTRTMRTYCLVYPAERLIICPSNENKEKINLIAGDVTTTESTQPKAKYSYKY